MGTTRLTRAKAAALVTDNPPTTTAAAAKKPLQSKTSSTTNTLHRPAVQPQRKRAALGDVSNVTKSEVPDAKEMKKGLTNTKAGLVSKASQVAGVQKAARSNATRSVLGATEANRRMTNAELKRPGSGSGVMGGLQKKRNTTSTASQPSIKEEDAEQDRAELGIRDRAFTVEIESREHVEVTVEEEGTTTSQAQADGHVKAPRVDAVKNLDWEDLEDPLMVAEYVVEIFEYLRELERKTMPNPKYMDHQEDLEWKMRGILVDWLIEVHTRFHLLPETLFLAVNIVDRFLSLKVVQLDRLQLVGVTAMFIASKYEEVISPHVANFRHVADDGFTEQEILSAERYILSALDYDLSYPNPMNFLRRISKADGYDIQTRTLGKYLLEISLLDHRFMRYHPSHLGAAAMYLARLILDRGEWVCLYYTPILIFIQFTQSCLPAVHVFTPANMCESKDATLAHYAGYTEDEIEPVFKLMIDYLARPVAHEAIFKKYASKKFLKGESLLFFFSLPSSFSHIRSLRKPQIPPSPL